MKLDMTDEADIAIAELINARHVDVSVDITTGDLLLQINRAGIEEAESLFDKSDGRVCGTHNSPLFDYDTHPYRCEAREAGEVMGACVFL